MKFGRLEWIMVAVLAIGFICVIIAWRATP
jgi:energy-converting hydrogenase Eha subunit C